MKISFIAEENIIHNVSTSFDNDLVVNGLKCLLNVLLDEDVDMFATLYAIASSDGLLMVTQMNGHTLSGVIA